MVLYGDCFSCGDFTFVYWIMKYLGHQKVEILRGPAAGLPTAAGSVAVGPPPLSPSPRPELLADYESVASGQFCGRRRGDPRPVRSRSHRRSDQHRLQQGDGRKLDQGRCRPGRDLRQPGSRSARRRLSKTVARHPSSGTP